MTCSNLKEKITGQTCHRPYERPYEIILINCEINLMLIWFANSII